jgi:hypothetical protein
MVVHRSCGATGEQEGTVSTGKHAASIHVRNHPGTKHGGPTVMPLAQHLPKGSHGDGTPA